MYDFVMLFCNQQKCENMAKPYISLIYIYNFMCIFLAVQVFAAKLLTMLTINFDERQSWKQNIVDHF